MLHCVLVVWYTQFSFCLTCEMNFEPNWNIEFWIGALNWMLGTAVCCTAPWENSLEFSIIKYYFHTLMSCFRNWFLHTTESVAGYGMLCQAYQSGTKRPVDRWISWHCPTHYSYILKTFFIYMTSSSYLLCNRKNIYCD